MLSPPTLRQTTNIVTHFQSFMFSEFLTVSLNNLFGRRTEHERLEMTILKLRPTICCVLSATCQMDAVKLNDGDRPLSNKT